MVLHAHSAYSDLPYVPSEDTQAGVAPESQPPETYPTSASIWDHTRNLQTHHTAPPHCHIQTPSITSNHPPGLNTYRTKKEKSSILLCSYITDLPYLKENQLLPQSHSPLPLLPIRPPTVVVINLLRPPPTLCSSLPPSLCTARCGVSHSGPALVAPTSTPSTHGSNLPLTGPEYADWLIQLQLLSP